MDIVRFKGGLGNQMFQYAFLKSLESKGRNVGASLGFYKEHPELRQFELDNVFPNIKMKTGFDAEFFRAYDKWCSIKYDNVKLDTFKKDLKNRFFWSEAAEEEGNYQEKVYETENCVFSGYWQTEKYFTEIRKELVKDFDFSDINKDYGLLLLSKRLLANDSYISIHVRRGDYLQWPEIYGEICTEQYYQDAMTLLETKVHCPIFVFFSDDINWVKSHLRRAEGIYIDNSIFDHYQPWYDMYLMSCCSHNIIANSSFSWWGAWLNQRENRQVVAPKKWFYSQDRRDVCPEDWIRL